MKNLMIAAVFATGVCAAVEAAPTDTVTQADLKALIERVTNLEAQNKAQAKRIAELEAAAGGKAAAKPAAEAKADVDTKVSESGRVYSTASGRKYYLADSTANIFEPLTKGGLQFQPYGYLVLEGVYNTAGTDYPMYTDAVRPANAPNHAGDDHTATLSVNDSIIGFNLFTPEAWNNWKFDGKFEIDLAGDDANHPAFHVRHLYWNMAHENDEHDTDWSILFGQTWHLWKMVEPSEIDGAWMENTGYPYRRSPQIRVTRTWTWDDSVLEARVGFVKNGPGMGGDRDDNEIQDNEQSAWGLIEGAILYSHSAAWEKDKDRSWLVGIGGQYGKDNGHRFNPVTGEFDGPDDSYDSDMLMFAASIPFLDKFTLCGQVYFGENLGGVQGGAGQKVAWTDPTHKGHSVRTIGGFADLKYELNDTWSFAAGYGFDNPVVHNNEIIETNNSYSGITYNDRAYVDAFYQWNDNLHFGVEYAYLTTDYVGGWDDNNSHRFQFTVYYDF